MPAHHLSNALRQLAGYARALPRWPAGLHAEPMWPAAGSRGVAVTVCGFGDSAGTWRRLHTALVDWGFGVVPVMWRPLGTSLDGLTERVAAVAAAARDQAGGGPVHLVGHSVGGVMARRAVQRGPLYGTVDSVTTVASPHRGTPLARLVRRWLPVAADLERLDAIADAADRDPAAATWTAVVVPDDLIVPADRQTLADIPGARMVHVPGRDHLSALRDDRTVAAVCAASGCEAAAA